MDTSFFSDMNWLAVLVAAVAYFMLGALWYSKALFGNAWIKYSGVDMSNTDARKSMGGIMVFTLLLELITCIGLAILVDRIMLMGVMSGLKLGFFTGICFCSIAVTISYLYQSKSLNLAAIDGGYHIIGNIVAAVILCVWP